MNCKPGDLAYIKREPYLGHFVTVLRWSGQGDDFAPNGDLLINKYGGWLCEKQCGEFVVRTQNGGMRKTPFAVIYDECLRPVRPDKGTDETLTWASKPEAVAA